MTSARDARVARDDETAVKPARVAVVGAGAWGTALANLLAGSGARVRLWAREPEVAASFRERGENALYLEGVPLNSEGLAVVSGGLAEALENAEVVVWACPVQFSAAVLADAAPFLPADALVVAASKGIEVGTLRRVDQIFEGALRAEQQRRLCVLSGPSFAREVATGAPTAVVVASRSARARISAQRLFQTERFRVYTNPDVVGVELGGALKNVVALAAGVAAGLELGHNAVAALITRGLAEMTRLGVAMGAQPATFAGLAGLGDLVLTCTSGLSRNRTVGFRLGRGEPIGTILGETRSVAEGVATVRAVHRLARRLGIEMPVAEEVHRIVAEDADRLQALRRLMTREPKSETESAGQLYREQLPPTERM